ncbi:MAG: hypothetical protein LBJ84_02795, partial [Oscillospiraceae bacterium]|nr:hypothetical protein [Oscillospiraceae bacterium]
YAFRVAAAKGIEDDRLQTFAIAGILVAAAKSAQEIARLKAAAAAADADARAAAVESLGFMARAGVHESDLKLYAQIHSISDDDYERAVGN